MTTSRIHTPATPVPAWSWGAELVVLATIAISTTNLLLLAVMWVCLVVTLAMLGNHPGVLATTRWLSGIVVVWWIIMAVVSPSADSAMGSVMWRLPTWSPGPGVHLGGVMTASGLLLTMTPMMRALVLVTLLGVGMAAVPPTSASAAGRRLLGSWSPALEFFAALPPALDRHAVYATARPTEIAATTREGASGLARRHRPLASWTASVRALILIICMTVPFVALTSGHAFPGVDQATTTLMAFVVAVLLTALLPNGEPIGTISALSLVVAILAVITLALWVIGVDGSAVTPHPGWPPVPVANLICVVALPLVVAVVGPRRRQGVPA
ncbi:hypothetical protein O6R08_08320 [Cutibacterium equinum]|uniref:Uncharacterized protein n=1 Tax=Cutibacterium equinum TaxID=3016342 RepID=A0ABY7QY98_9ACTN|nr:hypothetical protein [Cutibacterium equinum]WCC79512.1 hypothetical protein O6R08_08320 [Cutibacterium equinum]